MEGRIATRPPTAKIILARISNLQGLLHAQFELPGSAPGPRLRESTETAKNPTPCPLNRRLFLRASGRAPNDTHRYGASHIHNTACGQTAPRLNPNASADRGAPELLGPGHLPAPVEPAVSTRRLAAQGGFD